MIRRALAGDDEPGFVQSRPEPRETRPNPTPFPGVWLRVFLPVALLVLGCAALLYDDVAGAHHVRGFVGGIIGVLLLLAGGTLWLTRALGVQQQAERVAREQLRIFQRIVDNVPAPVFFRDERGVFKFVNAAFVEPFGVRPDAIVGGTVRDFLPAEDAAAEEALDRDVMASRSAHRSEVVTRDREGRRRDMLLSRAPMMDEAGNVLGITGVLIDITDHREAEEELQTAQGQLTDAIESLDAGLVMYGPDERLVVCNRRYKEIYPAAAPSRNRPWPIAGSGSATAGRAMAES